MIGTIWHNRFCSWRKVLKIYPTEHTIVNNIRVFAHDLSELFFILGKENRSKSPKNVSDMDPRLAFGRITVLILFAVFNLGQFQSSHIAHIYICLFGLGVEHIRNTVVFFTCVLHIANGAVLNCLVLIAKQRLADWCWPCACFWLQHTVSTSSNITPWSTSTLWTTPAIAPHCLTTTQRRRWQPIGCHPPINPHNTPARVPTTPPISSPTWSMVGVAVWECLPGTGTFYGFMTVTAFFIKIKHEHS